MARARSSRCTSAARFDEGPTPISALIHAATMVTAGHLHVARMSAAVRTVRHALSFVMTIGAITALFMGFLRVIQKTSSVSSRIRRSASSAT